MTQEPYGVQQQVHQPMYPNVTPPPPSQYPPDVTGIPQEAPVYVQPQIEIRPPASNATSFVPDVSTQSIIESVHPELLNAMVNIAIKKFSITDEFISFYIRAEARAKAEARQSAIKDVQKEEPKESNSNVDFSSW